MKILKRIDDLDGINTLQLSLLNDMKFFNWGKGCISWSLIYQTAQYNFVGDGDNLIVDKFNLLYITHL